jgi:hypothetical protein
LDVPGKEIHMSIMGDYIARRVTEGNLSDQGQFAIAFAILELAEAIRDSDIADAIRASDPSSELGNIAGALASIARAAFQIDCTLSGK